MMCLNLSTSSIDRHITRMEMWKDGLNASTLSVKRHIIKREV